MDATEVPYRIKLLLEFYLWPDHEPKDGLVYEFGVSYLTKVGAIAPCCEYASGFHITPIGVAWVREICNVHPRVKERYLNSPKI